MTDDAVLRDILTTYRRIAVVGMSKNPEKEAHTVPEYLHDHGYTIIPVNPTATEILGLTAYPTLRAIPGEYDVVDLFRPSPDIPPFVEEALADGRAKVIWMQLGIRNDDAARKAEAAGLLVVQSRCMRTEHQRLIGG